MDINEYYKEFMQDIYARSGAEQNFTEAIFTEQMCDFLVDQANIQNYTYSGYKNSPRGIRVDAWDFNEDSEDLYLFITDFRHNNELENLSNSEVHRNFRRLEKFFKESLEVNFHFSLEESSPGYELAREIYELNRFRKVSSIHFFLLTNAQLSKRVIEFNKHEFENLNSSYAIWDISRLFRLEISGKAREDIIIDFQEFVSDGIPCLPAFTGSNEFESYLLVMPGEILADLYDRYDERLLEQNVRTFLQFRGNVNKGIRNTIQNEPEMFFAYNNGLSTTAESVQTDSSRTKILSVKNLQIVNGGQTTASIFTAKKKNRADLSKVYVQIKLTIIHPDEVELVVPRISEYANTQNKVSAADFFSNHPFHLRIEEFSRRLWAPSPQGSLRESHWFYERARGQYTNALANLTPSKKNEFLSKNPRSQMFTKTDLAKFEFSLDKLPHIVSMGAQKNFAKFASEIGQKWESNEKQFNELYFQTLIAKAILFRFMDKNIMKQNWYGGYKANIITYSLSKFADLVSKTGRYLNYEQIWKDQKLLPSFEVQLLTIAELVNNHIQDTPSGITNVTEWCKKELCWKRLQEKPIHLNEEVEIYLISNDEVNSQKTDAEKTQKIDNGIFTQKYVIDKGGDYWKLLAKFGLEESLLSQKEMSILEIACSMPNKIPSEKQSGIIVNVEEKLKKEGFFIEE